MAMERIQVRVPADRKEILEKMIYALLYQDDPKQKIIYDAIANNRDKTLSQIAYMLRTKQGVYKSAAALKNFATRCGLPFNDQLSRSSTKPESSKTKR